MVQRQAWRCLDSIPRALRTASRDEASRVQQQQCWRRSQSTLSASQGGSTRAISRRSTQIQGTSTVLRVRYQLIRPISRPFSTTLQQQHGDITPPKPGQERHVTFIDKEGQSHTFEVADGDNLLDIAQANDLEMEGACGGSCACSTCHVIVQDDGMYDKMEEPSDDENDMLDLAFGLTETSRLGCQVCMSKELDGLVVKLPSMTRNMQASDFAEKETKS